MADTIDEIELNDESAPADSTARNHAYVELTKLFSYVGLRYHEFMEADPEAAERLADYFVGKETHFPDVIPAAKALLTVLAEEEQPDDVVDAAEELRDEIDAMELGVGDIDDDEPDDDEPTEDELAEMPDDEGGAE